MSLAILVASRIYALRARMMSGWGAQEEFTPSEVEGNLELLQV